MVLLSFSYCPKGLFIMDNYINCGYCLCCLILMMKFCWVVWSTIIGGIYLKFMKIYVYFENGHVGMICVVKWWFWYVYAWYVLGGWNEYLEVSMSKWNMQLICEVWWCVKCYKCELSTSRSHCYELWHYVKGVLTHKLVFMNEVNEWKWGIVGWTLLVSRDEVSKPSLVYISI